MTSRRSFLAAGAAGALPLRPQSTPAARTESISVISQEPGYYCGWATLAARKNGDLLVAYSGGREAHVCPFGRVELIRSFDGGTSWSWPEVLMDTAIDDRDAGVLETSAGTLLVTTFTSLAYEGVQARSKEWEPERVARWEAVQRRTTPEQRKALLGTWMLRSTDGGMTWTAPYRVPVNSPHGPIALKNGRLLYPGKKLWDPEKEVGVAESSDDGKTWRWLSVIPTRPGDKAADYHELHGIQADDGTVIVQIRNHNPENARETLQCESRDGGKTWTTPHAIGVWGLPSHLLRLSNGHLLMSYGYRRAPFGNQARVSTDHGRTWSGPITISDDGIGGDLGYPATVELPGGKLITVWYELMKGSSRAVLRQAVWALV